MKGGIRRRRRKSSKVWTSRRSGALAYPEFVHHEQLGTGPGGSAFSEAPGGDDEEVPV